MLIIEMQIKGRNKTDRRGVSGLETPEEEVHTTCVCGGKKTGQVLWLPEPIFMEEVIVVKGHHQLAGLLHDSSIPVSFFYFIDINSMPHYTVILHALRYLFLQ